MNKKYRILRTCISCSNEQEVFVTKREAAFDLIDYRQVFGETCTKCPSTRFAISHQTPDLDLELLLEWANDTNLFLIEQDEELLLADEKYLELILELLDKHLILEHKQHILMDALCILVYDITVDEEFHRNDALKQRVIAEINQRKDKLHLADERIMPYIKKVVYPQLITN